jgi:hypothetical protein
MPKSGKLGKGEVRLLYPENRQRLEVFDTFNIFVFGNNNGGKAFCRTAKKGIEEVRHNSGASRSSSSLSF